MASFLCKPEDVISALKELENLLSEKSLKERGVLGFGECFLKEVENLKQFLSFLVRELESRTFEDYAKLLEFLDSLEVKDRKFLEFLPYKDSLITALSIFAVKKREEALRLLFQESLERVGRIEDDEFAESEEEYFEEFKRSLALFYALKVVGNKVGISLIKNLRNSIGGREVEEYFADLTVGWIYEDWFLKKLKKTLKNCSVVPHGVDADRKVKFSKPTGDSDVLVQCKTEEGKTKKVRLDVQRVGDRSCQDAGDYLEVELKDHKVSKNDFVVFVFPVAFKKFEPLSGKVLVVPTKEVKGFWYKLNESKALNLKEEILSSPSLRKNTKDAIKKLFDELMKKSKEEKVLSRSAVDGFVSNFRKKKLEKFASKEELVRRLYDLFENLGGENFSYEIKRKKGFLKVKKSYAEKKAFSAFDRRHIAELLDIGCS